MIGSSVPRGEDAALLTGITEFVDDFSPSQTSFASFVRSPVAHGRIRSIETDEALKLPGVCGVYTGKDLGNLSITPAVRNPKVAIVPRPVLATDTVNFSGEPVAVVVADDPYLAEDAAELVVLNIDELPAITDPESALASDAPRLHALDSNVVFHTEFESGATAERFTEAELTFERTFELGRQSAAPMETRGVLAYSSPDGKLTVRSSMQAPNRLHDALAEVLAKDPETVRVLTPDIGGSFGQKGDVFPEDVAVSWLAMRLDRPVKWIEDRTENLMAASNSRDQSVCVKVAAKRDGTITAVDAKILVDLGAYGSRPHGPLVEAAGTPAMIPGPYRLPAYRYTTSAVVTNKSSYGAYRGVGATMATFVHERIIETVASLCGLDSSEVRSRNFIAVSEMPYTSITGHTYDTGDYEHAFTLAQNKISSTASLRRHEYRDNPDIQIGMGLACFVEHAAITPAEYQRRGMVGTRGDDTARVELDDQGTIHIWTSLPAVGQGSATGFAQIAADKLAIPLDRIVVHRPDTQIEHMVGTGTGSSRSMVSGGAAVSEATAALAEKIRAELSVLANPANSDFSLAADGVRTGDLDSQTIRYVDIVKAGPEQTMAAMSTFGPEEMVYPSGCHACIVAANRKTGRIAVLDYVVVEDCGRVINPAIVEGQLRGGVAQGIGAALLEHHQYDDQGQIQTSLMMDYQLPNACDIPDIDIVLVGEPTPNSVLGVKGMGESGAIPSPAAVANAVANATDREVTSLPITSEWASRTSLASTSNVTDQQQPKPLILFRKPGLARRICATVAAVGSMLAVTLSIRWYLRRRIK